MLIAQGLGLDSTVGGVAAYGYGVKQLVLIPIIVFLARLRAYVFRAQARC